MESSDEITDMGNPVQPVSHWEDTLGFRRDACFASTRWTLVSRARSGSDTEAGEAMSNICRSYWYPLYAYTRRRGHSREVAEDSTQAFFAYLLKNDTLADARQHKGKLRTFLLTVLKRFLIKEWKHASAEKRGGGRPDLPINFDEGEERYGHEPVDLASPDDLYEKQWATTLLARVLESLRLDYVSRDMEDRYEALHDALWWNANETSYASLAEKLAMNENSVKQAVSRMRNQYRNLLKEEIRSTLNAEDDATVNEELVCLIEVLRKP